MAVNRTKVLEAAQKFLSKGQYDKAIAEYQKLVQEDPRDVRTLLKIGDLHTRRNKPRDAVEVYDRVADLYAKQGFFLKAVAVYKQILKLDPGHLQSLTKLAKMYEELALTSDALATYEQVADAHLAEGRTPQALEVMQRMIDIDGDNIAIHIKFAEALSKAGKPDEAAQAFSRGATLLKSQGRTDDYIRVVERQLFHAPDDAALSRELAGLYLERRDPKRALAKLQTCFKSDPRDIQTLEMLAEAFSQLGQGAKTISVLKEIARLHGEVNAAEPRKRTLERVLALDPNDAEARQALANFAPAARATAPDAAPAPPQPQPEVEEFQEEELEEIDLEAEDELALLEEDTEEDEEALLIVDEPEEEEAPPPPAPAVPSAPPPASSPGSDIRALLESADEQEAAGEFEEAEFCLRRVLAIDPEHAAAHERLKDLFLATDRHEEAVGELLWLSEAWAERNPERAEQLARAAHELSPHSEAARQRLQALGVIPSRAERVADEPEAGPAAAPAFSSPSPATGRERPAVRSQPARDASGEPEELLDIPIRPSDFSAPPPSPHDWQGDDAYFAQLLERQIDPHEFEREELLTTGALPPRRTDVAALLDAPISPDEFDAPAVAPPSPPADRPDDFGLSDERFYNSALHEMEVDEPAEPAALEVVPEQETFAPVDTQEVEVAEEDADQASAAWDQTDAHQESSTGGTSDAFHLLEQLDADSAEAWLINEQAGESGAAGSDADAFEWKEPPDGDAFEDDLLLVQDEAPDPTVPAAPIPDLLRRSSEVGLADEHTSGGAAPPLEPTADAPAMEEPQALQLEPDAALDRPAPADAAQELVRRPPSEPPAAPTPSEPPAAPTPSEPPAAPTPSEPPPEVAAAPKLQVSTDVETAPSAGGGAASAPTELAPEIEEALDEAEFFASQGLLDEALEVVQEAILIFPKNELLKQRLQEYEAKADELEEVEEQAAASAPEPAPRDDSFDIAKQLAEELSEPGQPSGPDDFIDVESVFAQFKAGVAQQVAPDDTDTHFDLGIAYKEMGLIDDAIHEFELSSQTPKRACNALTMIGMCQLEKGEPAKAIDYFERALKAEHGLPTEELALHYELGNAYELVGQLDDAANAFEKVVARDRSFRNASARLDQLKRRTRNPKENTLS